MIRRELIEPRSIVVIGASNDLSKPGGKIFNNLIIGGYKGKLYPLNPKESEIQGYKCLNSTEELAEAELAILAIAAKNIPDTMTLLAKSKGTKAFIVLSAGFSETGKEGKELEKKISRIAQSSGASLLGPNCIGLINTNYAGVFAGPIPKLNPQGCDFVTGSGATAVFFLETAINMGVPFSSVFSVGNSALIGVEEVLQYWDETYTEGVSSKIKLIYIEQVSNPALFLKHSRSLINKGCRIAAIKAGTTDAGSRAVSSHTGALAGSDTAVEALFKKAGIVRCNGRDELANVAGIFCYDKPKGNRFAVITHAGGPAVMMTDRLAKAGIDVPVIEGNYAEELKNKLFHGSSVANPIDFLATGTPEQLGEIIDYVENKFDNIDASAVIFGTPGLYDVKDAYKVLNEKMNICRKPIFPILPSVVQAAEAIDYFKSLGKVCFYDEVNLAAGLDKVYNTPEPAVDTELIEINRGAIRKIIENSVYGYLTPVSVATLLDSAGIPRAQETLVYNLDDALFEGEKLGYPLVMKVVGPVHKSDVGGVALNLKGADEVEMNFNRMMRIPRASGVLLQPIYSGTEIFIGAKYEKNFGHIILCGLGGIFIEVMKDFSAGLCPIGKDEALYMIRNLRSYDIIKGVRGKEGISEELWADIIVRLSALLIAAPEISELDLNPLLAKSDSIIAVDARMRIQKL